jgi:hypothetical protein
MAAPPRLSACVAVCLRGCLLQVADFAPEDLLRKCPAVTTMCRISSERVALGCVDGAAFAHSRALTLACMSTMDRVCDHVCDGFPPLECSCAC